MQRPHDNAYHCTSETSAPRNHNHSNLRTLMYDRPPIDLASRYAIVLSSKLSATVPY